MTTPQLKKAINRSLLRLVFFLIMLALASFAPAPTTRAALPPPAPDGGYPGNNTAEGNGALSSVQINTTNNTGINNTANGASALNNTTSGNYNTANGAFALSTNTTGINNTADGAGALNHNTGSYGSAFGSGALYNNTTGIDNTAIGSAALYSNTTGSNNLAIGNIALYSNTTGHGNTANGIQSLHSNTTGIWNTATGDAALYTNTTGDYNTADGLEALYSNKTAIFDIALGYSAGSNLSTGSNNIDIGNLGLAGESNIIRIGNDVAVTDREGVVHPAHTKTFIAGVHGATASGGAAVFVNSAGQLGTLTSSARFKEAIKPMDKASEAILSLKPVTFHYKKDLDRNGIPQFGLVAEQVEKVNADLVARDAEGKPYTVRYEAVNAMLLNEFLKEHRKVEEQQATIAQMKKQIDSLTAGLQKVSDQMELAKAASQAVAASQ